MRMKKPRSISMDMILGLGTEPSSMLWLESVIFIAALPMVSVFVPEVRTLWASHPHPCGVESMRFSGARSTPTCTFRSMGLRPNAACRRRPTVWCTGRQRFLCALRLEGSCECLRGSLLRWSCFSPPFLSLSWDINDACGERASIG